MARQHGPTAAALPADVRTPGQLAADSILRELASQRRSGRQLAAAVGWSPATCSRRLNGQHPLTVDELYAVASYLGLPAAALLPSAAAVAGVRALELAG